MSGDTSLVCAVSANSANDGLPREFVQTNLSYNRAARTFRGLHYQAPPSREGKLVRCIRGAIADVIVDLRPESRSYLVTSGSASIQRCSGLSSFRPDSPMAS